MYYKQLMLETYDELPECTISDIKDGFPKLGDPNQGKGFRGPNKQEQCMAFDQPPQPTKQECY